MKPEDRRACETALSQYQKLFEGKGFLISHADFHHGFDCGLAHRDAQPAVAQGEAVDLRELFERLLFGTYAGKDSYYNDEQIKHGCFERAQELADAAKRMNIALYTEAPAVAQSETDGWHFKFNSGAESFVTNVDAADLIRTGLQAGETCTEYLKKDSASEVGISKTETTTKAPAVVQGVPIGYVDTERLDVSGMTWAVKEKTRDVHAPIYLQPPADVMRELVEVLSTEVHRQLKEGLAMPRDDLKKALAALKSAKEHRL